MRPLINLTALTISLLSSSALLANPHLSPYGVTDGGASHHGAMNLSGNPAAPSSVRWEYDSKSAADSRSFDSGFALGLIRVGAGFNYGQVDDVFNEADRIYDTLENNDSITNNELSALATDAENVLGLLEDKGYINASLYGSALPLEVASQKMGGVWTLHPYVDFNTNANFSGSSVDCRSSLDEEGQFYDCSDYLQGTASNSESNMSACSVYLLDLLDYSSGQNPPANAINDCLIEQFGSTDLEDIDGSGLAGCERALFDYGLGSDTDTTTIAEQCTFDMDSDAAMHLRLGLFTGIGVGYSTRIRDIGTGGVFIGGRGKIISGNLYTKKITYDDIVNEYDNDAQKMIEDIQADYSSNATSSSGLALDLGVLWTSRNARVGLSMDNALAPQFNYVDENGDSQKYQLPQQSRFEASIYPKERWIYLSYVQDLAEAEAFSGERTQWRKISVGFVPDWLFVHGRVGRSEELVSGLSYTTFGLSLFSMVHADFGMSDQTVTIEGDKVSRGGYFAVGFEYVH